MDYRVYNIHYWGHLGIMDKKMENTRDCQNDPSLHSAECKECSLLFNIKALQMLRL